MITLKERTEKMSFENRFSTTKAMYWEFVNKILCRRMRRMAWVVALIGVIGFLVGVVLEATPLLWLSDAALVLVLAVVILSPHIIMKQLIDYDKRVHGGEHPECVVTFGDSIRMEEGTVSIEIGYDQIIAWYHLQTCSILMFTKQNGIMYKDDGFVGDASGFDKFIKEKCVNLKKTAKR